MKKILLAVSLLLVLSALIPFLSQSQLQKTSLPDLTKIGEAKITGAFVAGLSYMVVGYDTTYVLSFDNARYSTITDIQSISFNHSPGILDTLYNMLNDALEMEKGKDITFKLGKEDIVVTENRMMGTKFIEIMMIRNKAYFALRKNQLMKLFNKSN